MGTLRDWLQQGEHTLALSSAFFGFYAHLGVVTALAEEDIVPNRLAGSSAGALVAAAVASGLELAHIREILFGVRRADFWDPRPGLGFLRGRRMRELLEAHFAPTFGHANRPLEIAVFDVLARRTRFLREGSLPAAVAASCAVPLMFHPVWIEGRPYLDGGVFHKSGIPEARANERVLCVYLESSRWLTNAYELKQTWRGLQRGHRVLRLTDLPAVLPHTLEEGPRAYREAYERTKRALDTPLAGRVLRA